MAYLLSICLSAIVICFVFFENQGYLEIEPVAPRYSASCTHFFDYFGNRPVLLTISENPVCPSGEKALHALFTKNLKFSVDQGCDQCDFRIYYTIEKDGTAVLKKFVGSFLTMKDYELIGAQLKEIFERMEHWQPGKCNGENVPVAMVEKIYY